MSNRYKSLLAYLDARSSRRPGWVNDYADTVTRNSITGGSRWPYLAGHYEALLEDVLSVIPEETVRLMISALEKLEPRND